MRIVLAKFLPDEPKAKSKDKSKGKKGKGFALMHRMMIGGGMNRIGDLTPMMALLTKFMVGMTLIGKMNLGMKVGQVTLGNSMRLRSPVLSLIWIPVKPRKRNERKKSQQEV